MTKKVLIKWLEQLKSKALSTVDEQRRTALKKYDEELYEKVGLREIADKVQALFTEADRLVTEWHAKYEEYLVTSGRYYGSVHGVCYDFICGKDATYNRMKSREFAEDSKPRVAFRRQFDTLRNEVGENYDNVLLNVQRLKDAKLGMDYLKELGFDLTELLAQDNAPVETALAVPIDTRFLFITQSKEDAENED